MTPLQFLILTVSGWLTRRQQYAIEYLKEENRILHKRLGGKRLYFTDKERRRLAVKKQRCLAEKHSRRLLVLRHRIRCCVGIDSLSPKNMMAVRREAREDHLRCAVSEYVVQYNAERNHQGLENELITAQTAVVDPNSRVRCRERLGGILNYYFCEAA
jgi:hypothetical protein